MPEKDFNTLAQEVEKFFNDHDKTCNAIEKAMKTQLRNLHKVKHDIDEDKELAEMAKKHHDNGLHAVRWKHYTRNIHTNSSCTSARKSLKYALNRKLKSTF